MVARKIIASAALAALVLAPLPSLAQGSPGAAAPRLPPPGISGAAPGVGAGAGAGLGAVGGLTLQETILLSVLALSSVAVGGVLVADAVKTDAPVSP